VANNLLRWVRDYATSKANGKIVPELTKAALEMAGIDSLGLDRQDRKYLATIIRVFAGGPAGVEAIAHTMNTSTDTLADEVEPYLLRSELVVRTPRGRMATVKAYEHLQIALPTAADESAQGLPTAAQPRLFD
jgi:Holliday junction DNA helicase RuvB